MKFDWNSDKNKLLKSTRGVSFELIVKEFKRNHIVADLPHQNPIKYPKQRHFIVFIKNYVYVVPYVRNGLVVFFKTIYPSRKYYKIYIKNGQKNKV